MIDFEEILYINCTFVNLSIRSALLYIFNTQKVLYKFQDLVLVLFKITKGVSNNLQKTLT